MSKKNILLIIPIFFTSLMLAAQQRMPEDLEVISKMLPELEGVKLESGRYIPKPGVKPPWDLMDHVYLKREKGSVNSASARTFAPNTLNEDTSFEIQRQSNYTAVQIKSSEHALNLATNFMSPFAGEQVSVLKVQDGHFLGFVRCQKKQTCEVVNNEVCDFLGKEIKSKNISPQEATEVAHQLNVNQPLSDSIKQTKEMLLKEARATKHFDDFYGNIKFRYDREGVAPLNSEGNMKYVSSLREKCQILEASRKKEISGIMGSVRANWEFKKDANFFSKTFKVCDLVSVKNQECKILQTLFKTDDNKVETGRGIPAAAH